MTTRGDTVLGSDSLFGDEFATTLEESKRNPAVRAAYEDAREKSLLIDGLIRRRKELGLTQTALAERIGVRQPTVSGFETEDSDPRLSTLQRYARAVEGRVHVRIVYDRQCDWIASRSYAYQSADRRIKTDADAAIRSSSAELLSEWKRRLTSAPSAQDDYALGA